MVILNIIEAIYIFKGSDDDSIVIVYNYFIDRPKPIEMDETIIGKILRNRRDHDNLKFPKDDDIMIIQNS